MRCLTLILAGMVAAVVPVAAIADEAPRTCPADPVLPPEWAGWAMIGSNKTMSVYRETAAAEWPSLRDRRTGLALHPADRMQYRVAPERTPDPAKRGGMVPIAVEKAGRLAIALDSGAWIDLVKDGQIVKSVKHGHGPACSGIRKIVEFDVTPGRYLLQIVNAPDVSIRAMAVQR